MTRRDRRILAGLAAALAAMLGAGPAALAQAPAGPTFGPATPGVCLFDQAQAVANSQAGVSAEQQIKEFAVGIDAELKAERTAIYNDDHALALQKASLPSADYDQRVAQLRQRYAEVDHTRTVRDAQLDATRKTAAVQIMAALTPSLNEVITQRRCSFVLQRSVTYAAADALDITADVVQRMDARLNYVPLQLAPPPPEPPPAQ